MPTKSYTKENLTCHVLVENNSLEYIVKSPVPLFGVVDLLLGLSAAIVSWTSPSLVHTHPRWVAAIALIWIWSKYKTIHHESLLVMRDIGIQVKTVYWGGSVVSKFISRRDIEDVVINEGINFWQIKSYIAILVKDQEKMNLLPSLRPVLLDVYQGTRSVLFPAQQSLFLKK
ncbi:hypothetical protein J3Q64DRAFT_1853225 [Phycomyces blakesleeanus]|uniref:Phosphatidylinositol N-acetylglucosaminyltransferase subunit H conserved domain-containing protein n=2 Tax=Phycomyces blakesleeanus TaxID=4837 RepID=A0A167JNV6_PHYB8|nr:hypothetical protein PHYBLDRAFT_152471 [Phycomyces blakesleeanus NRRL 1555(-)]OAD66398.1 hypothetical protein PHYBLDRAFT_152471 [Phycomyces blakesleeanus NRRL 1555(-)]|eukprot:XP_018284438.1 hypothetical protein PHYBLDRAFT_152471 [Phycomyces blakesleeanus NRRL 1555(-)]